MRRQYTVTLRGRAPADLCKRLAAIHAAALLHESAANLALGQPEEKTGHPLRHLAEAKEGAPRREAAGRDKMRKGPEAA